MTVPSIDAGAQYTSSGVASFPIPVTTLTTNDVLLVVACMEQPHSGGLVAQVTGISGAPFARRSQTIKLNVPDPNSIVNPANLTLEVWAAPAPTITTYPMTIFFNAAVDSFVVEVLAIKGVQNINAPWDPNPALPVIGSSTSAIPNLTYSTTNADDFGLAIVIATQITAFGTGPTGWTFAGGHATAGSGSGCQISYYTQSFSSPQTSTAFNWIGNTFGGIDELDFFTADTGGHPTVCGTIPLPS